jgi:hypothetical protein
MLMHGVYDRYEQMAGAHFYKRSILTLGCNQVLEATSQSQLMEISYDNTTRYNHEDPSFAEETLLVEIS